jgi:fatty-acid desaturase
MWNINLKTASLALLSSTALFFGMVEIWYLFCVDYSIVSYFWIVCSLIYTAVIYELFLHFVIGHQVIKYRVDSIFFKILIFLTTIGPSVGIKNMAMQHASHHRYADQNNRDSVHSRQRWYTTGFFTPLMYVYQPNQLVIPNEKVYYSNQAQKHQTLLNDPWVTFCDQHQVLITVVTWSLLYVFAPFLLLKLLFIGRVFASIGHGCTVIFGHHKRCFGYRNFNAPNQSHNNLIAHYLFLTLLPSMLHNNHHGMNFNKGHRYRWYEFDLGSLILFKIIKPLIT